MSKSIEQQFYEAFYIPSKKECYYWDCPYSTGEVAKDVPLEKKDCENCNNNYYKIGHLSYNPDELGKSYYWLKDNNQIEENIEIVQGYCEKQNAPRNFTPIFIKDRLKNLDFIEEYLKR